MDEPSKYYLSRCSESILDPSGDPGCSPNTVPLRGLQGALPSPSGGKGGATSYLARVMEW